MADGKANKYAIIDVETTGLNARSDRITEIALYVHDGEKIIDHYETLINPDVRIPNHISMLTGITNKMVCSSPRFHEAARTIVEMTEGAVLVAHNAGFDYNFLRYEFKRLFFEYKRKTLCTKRLSRKLLPGLRSYGLGNLCKQLKILNHSRHRAGGDAMATVKLFEYLLRLEGGDPGGRISGYHSHLKPEVVDDLPEAPGVYYFLDEAGKIIYIGKSVNIRQRVISHLNNNQTKRAVEMRDQIREVNFQLTGSDLVAQLLESDEIKRHKPVFNRSQRRSVFSYGLFSYTGKDGYVRLKVDRIKKDQVPLTAYSSATEGRNHLNRMIIEYNLCQKLCGVYKTDKACFHFQIEECYGACIGKEPPESYNDRALDAIARYTYRNKNFFIIDDGRNEEELSIIKVENGAYIGFGYIAVSALNGNTGILHDVIKKYDDNRDIQVILKGYIRKNDFERIVIYD